MHADKRHKFLQSNVSKARDGGCVPGAAQVRQQRALPENDTHTSCQYQLPFAEGDKRGRNRAQALTTDIWTPLRSGM
jgi:hypothetical protein